MVPARTPEPAPPALVRSESPARVPRSATESPHSISANGSRLPSRSPQFPVGEPPSSPTVAPAARRAPPMVLPSVPLCWVHRRMRPKRYRCLGRTSSERLQSGAARVICAGHGPAGWSRRWGLGGRPPGVRRSRGSRWTAGRAGEIGALRRDVLRRWAIPGSGPCSHDVRCVWWALAPPSTSMPRMGWLSNQFWVGRASDIPPDCHLCAPPLRREATRLRGVKDRAQLR